jgi:tripartite-type tricarboxylate transporter receptor subunit TctC
LGRSDYVIPEANGDIVVNASLSEDGAIAATGITPDLLDLKARYLLGMTDSSQLASAVMRKEIDITSSSLSNAKRLIKSGDVKPILAFTREPVPDFPDSPFLAGENGLVAKRASRLSGTERASRLELADAVVSIFRNVRAMHIAATASEPTKQCVEDVLLKIARDESFVAEAKKAGLDVTPRTRADLNVYFKEKTQNIAKLRSIIDEKKKVILGQ